MINEKNKITIVTHDGQFHPDEIFAVAIICLVLEKENKNFPINIIRTRDKKIIESADNVVDVGSIYDPSVNRFDHHQKGGAGIRNNGIPYASFGLVWKTYGQVLTEDISVANEVEERLVMPIDAYDNGVGIYTTNNDVEPYTINNLFLAFRVTWKENVNQIDKRFTYLVDLAKNIIEREVKSIKDTQEAEVFVEEVYRSSKDKTLIILDKYLPWNRVISRYNDTRLVIFPDVKGTWSIEVVQDKDFINTRISLPKSWAGKRDSELETVTGVAGSIFCHSSRFVAFTKTRESAIALAQIALKEAGQ